MEIWKNLKHIKLSKYDISSIGNIRNIKNNINMTLSICKKTGYILKSLQLDNGERRQFAIHRLVLLGFSGQPIDDQTCDHINRIKSDNRLENLRWATRSEQATNKENVKKKTFKIIQMDKTHTKINNFNSIVEASNSINCSASLIGWGIKQNKLAKGFYWKYDNEDLINEVWKCIKLNDRDVYVSNEGRIKINNRIMIGGHFNKNNYSVIHINKNRYYRHLLIANAFIKNDNPQKTMVNHIDNNKHNCNINNLEWVTPSENIIHSFLINDNRFTVKVNQLNKDTLELINSFHSIRSASISTNISLQNISHCLNNRTKHAGGYIWTKVDSNINELLNKTNQE